MLILYTGNGKGKTSASVGQAVRALGQGLRIVFGQFMKRPGLAGEQRVLSELLKEKFYAGGAGFYRDANTYDRHRKKVLEVLDWALMEIDQGLDMLILDEALYALGHDLLKKNELVKLLKHAQKQNCHVVLSGRGAPAWLVERADIVSSVTEVRHIFAEGGKARKGIEF